MKTLEELAEQYLDQDKVACDAINHAAEDLVKSAFFAGYQAAQDTYKDAISTYEKVAKQMLEEAIGIMTPQDQLADADKVITYDYVETASNEAKELIAKFGLIDNEDVLVKALVAAYCRGVDAVDGYLRNSLSAYRASVKQQRWISVKDRLPEEGQDGITQVWLRKSSWIEEGYICPFVLGSHAMMYTIGENDKDGIEGICDIHKPDGVWEISDFTHWMPLSEAPKEDK